MATSTTLIPKESPRYEDNAIKWYVFDTFKLVFNITLKDADGTPIVKSSTQQMVFEFYDKRKQKVHEEIFGSDALPFPDLNNDGTYVFNVIISDTDSRKFPVGEYTYCITYKEGESSVSTVFSRGHIVVENYK